MPQSIDDLQDLTEPQQRVLHAFESDQELTDTFFLTGGTLLKALGIVPRESNDLDFFTFSHIDSLTYTQELVRIQKVLVELFGAEELTTTDRGLRHAASNMLIDCVNDSVPNIDAFASFGHLKTASMKDLAAHKASAICSRDEVKDYIDIAFLTKQYGWLLQDLERLAQQKFALGTITEEKLITELLTKREAFSITPNLFLRDGSENTNLVQQQITYLIEHTSL